MLFNIPSLTFEIGAFLSLTGYAALLARVLIAALILLALWLVSRFLKFKLIPRLIARTEGRRVKSIPILLKGFALPLPVLVWCGGIYLALCSLPWAHAGWTTLFATAFRILVTACLAWGLWNASDLCDLMIGRFRSQISGNKTLVFVLNKAYRILILFFGGIMILEETGLPVTGLITGAGLAGLTVSLAAQDSASNLFSGLMILLEHPFGIGDWIVVGDVEGTVEALSFRSTKVRALDNSLYVLPNSAVSSATINNVTNRTKRLYRFTLGVVYDTTRAQLEHLMADIADMLMKNQFVYPDSVLVHLTGFGDSSMDILISCYVKTTDLKEFLSIQNELNLNLIDVVNANGTSFAFPSTSIYIEKAPESARRTPDNVR